MPRNPSLADQRWAEGLERWLVIEMIYDMPRAELPELMFDLVQRPSCRPKQRRKSCTVIAFPRPA